MEHRTSLFETMKKRSLHSRSLTQTPEQLLFQLNFDEHGAYLRIIDEERKEIEPDSKVYKGPIREFLEAVDAIILKSAFNINWDKPSGRIYFAEHDHLIWLLRKCPNVIDATMRHIQFASEDIKGQIHVSIQPHEAQYETNFFLLYKRKTISPIMALTDNSVYANGKIYEIYPTGGKPQILRLFQTLIFPHELEHYLSLLLSAYPGIHISYKKYTVEEGESRSTFPSLFFEKIDADNTLYLRMSQSIPETEPTLMEQYDIQSYVSVNDTEKRILISRIQEIDLTAFVENLSKKLNHIKKIARTSSDFILDGTLFIIHEELAREFIRKELPLLVDEFAVFGAENLKSYKIKSVNPTLSVNFSHGIDFLEGDVDFIIDEEHFTLFDALTFYKQHGYVQLSNGTQAIPNVDYMRKLERIFFKHKKKVKLSFFDLPIIEDLLEENAAEKSFPYAKSIFRGFTTYHKAKYKVPTLNAELRPYQILGYKWLRYLHEHNLGGCLADDMGLGKTLQTIALLASIYPEAQTSTLIVMPKSLLFNWEQELQKFAPNIKYYTYYGQYRDLELAGKAEVILTTYSVLRHDIQHIKEKEFHAIILDESQNIKNLNSRTAKAAMLLHGKFRLALSGTPIENNIGELYSLFRFLNPAMFGSSEEFSKLYAIPIQKENSKDAAAELRRKIFPFILRRLKKEVAKELPDKIEQTLFVEMSPEQATYYEQRRNFYYQTIRDEIVNEGIEKSQFHILQALSDLRQIASSPEVKTEGKIISPKREILIEQVQDAVSNGHKVLIFTNYLGAVECITQDLLLANIGHVSMTGASTNRQDIVHAFQTDPDIKVFIMTLKTGGLGLNLTAADTIFMYDPWWNIAAENQAVDRSHRIGQHNTVLSYKLIARGTIEEKILRLQEKKKELFDAIISTDSASLKSLTEDDIEYILGKESDYEI